MDRLDVAIALKTMLDDVEGVSRLPQYKQRDALDLRVHMIFVYYAKQHWWLMGNHFGFKVLPDHTNKRYDAVPNNYLEAFIDFVFEGKHEHAVPSYLRQFPLTKPIQPVYVYNINGPDYV